MIHVRDVQRALDRLGLPTRRSGRGIYSLCPFHDDKLPMNSFTVHAEKGLFHCWVCGAKGDLITLAEKVIGVGFAAAKEWLLDEGDGIELKGVVVNVEPIRATRTYPGFPPGVVVEPLETWPAPARTYVEKRGLTAEQVMRWSIGLGIAGRLEGRIVIPTIESGRVVDWTARSYVGREPRYLMARANERRRGAVFGVQAWPALGERKVVALVEGAFNGLALERACGLPFATAHGSEISAEILARLATWPTVLICTDPDQAGKKAAGAAKVLARHGVRLLTPLFPPGVDANDLTPQDLARRVHDAIQAANP